MQPCTSVYKRSVPVVVLGSSPPVSMEAASTEGRLQGGGERALLGVNAAVQGSAGLHWACRDFQGHFFTK